MRSLTLAALSVITLPLALLMAPTATPAQDGPILLSPEAIGQIFCLARIGNDMSPVAGLVTADLAATITDALRRSGEWATRQSRRKAPARRRRSLGLVPRLRARMHRWNGRPR